jgi:hypothetical protein
LAESDELLVFDVRGLNPIDERKRDGGIPTFGEMADDVAGGAFCGR